MLLCCSMCLYPLLKRISQGCFLPLWWASLTGVLAGKQSCAVSATHVTVPSSFLFASMAFQSSHIITEIFVSCPSWCLTISCAWYKLQVVPRGTRQWEAGDLLQSRCGSSAVGDFIFRDRGVRVFAH